MTKSEFTNYSSSIPNKPGVYQYYNHEGVVIYVGKAKNLVKRISSYFVKQTSNLKTQRLVSEIVSIKFSIVDTEQDAFLLENSLIKQYQPKYNMMLKDDKSYPYLVIKKEPFPRIFIRRKKLEDGSEYIGPFSSVGQLRSVFEFIKQTLPFRTCNLNLTAKNINAGKFKPCMEYHLGNCKAPCVGWQSEQEYNWNIEQARKIFKGKMSDLISHYKDEIKNHVKKLEFEKAEIIKKKLDYIKDYQSKSIVVNTRLGDIDVCSILSNEEAAFINYLVVSGGSIIHTHTITIEKKLEESDEEILCYALDFFRNKYHSESKEIVSSIPIQYQEHTQITVPKVGDKKKLLQLSLQNTQYALLDFKRKKTLLLEEANEEYQVQILKQLQKDLKLPLLPVHIECFDNSNLQGSSPVAAMVCFKNGKKSPKDYRHFHIKTVEGINDFESMKEIVFRRYKRLIEEDKPLPQLVIIDGGKGQLSFAMQSIHALELQGKMTVVSLAKNIEEVFFPGDSESIRLPFQSQSLNFLKQIRDETHRFAITFHRRTRSKNNLSRKQIQIQGVSEKTIQILLQHFKSFKKMKEMGVQEIEKVISKAHANRVVNALSDMDF